MSYSLLILLVALSLSALFSGWEIAFVSSDKLRFEMDVERNTLGSKILGRFFHNPNIYISTMLVGNNIVLVVYSTMMAVILEGWFSNWFPSLLERELLLVLIETFISTAIVIVFGEFLPKTIFRINSNSTLNFFAVPIYVIYIILYPISLFTTWLSRVILKIFGVRINKKNTEKVFSKVELDYFVQSGLLDKKKNNKVDSEIKIFQNVLDFSKVKIRDCMIPRNEVISVDIDAELKDLQDLFVNTGFSKIIVYEDDIDHIVGYIHSSELFRHTHDWRDHIQTVPFVPETLMAQKLMKQLLARQKTMAVVVDEFGGTSGIVTLEDIVEEILGEIEDEHDVNSLIAKQTEDGYLLSGRLEIERVNELFGLSIPESDDYMTICGLILSKKKGFPKVNEILQIDDMTFRILKMGPTKIELVELLKSK